MSPCVLQRISLSVLRRVLQKASVKKTTPASVGHFMKEMVLPVKVNIVWGWRHHLWWQHICICISPSWTVSLSPVVKFVSLSLSEWWTSFYVSVMSFRHAPSGGQTVRVSIIFFSTDGNLSSLCLSAPSGRYVPVLERRLCQSSTLLPERWKSGVHMSSRILRGRIHMSPYWPLHFWS